jgi:hypothetical protein
MTSMALLMKAAEAKGVLPRTPEEARFRVERLETKKAREEHRLSVAEPGSPLAVGLESKVAAMGERLDLYQGILDRLTVVSDEDRVLGLFEVGKKDKKLATQVGEAAAIGDLRRTVRILVALKRAGYLDDEVTSLMVDGSRVRGRWWWRVR